MKYPSKEQRREHLSKERKEKIKKGMEEVYIKGKGG